MQWPVRVTCAKSSLVGVDGEDIILKKSRNVEKSNQMAPSPLKSSQLVIPVHHADWETGDFLGANIESRARPQQRRTPPARRKFPKVF